MNCPYCGKEMHAGTIRFDGRRRLIWSADNQSKSGFDRFWDSLGGVGELIAANYNWSGLGSISGSYCPACKKMIIDTAISR